MIKVSKMADYAVVILAALARSDRALVSAVSVSAQTGLPEPSVAKILKVLARAGILDSIRGANGGYKMTRAADEISVADIVVAMDGPISLTSCVEGSHEACGYEASCAVRGRWNTVNAAMRGALEGVTLADMLAAEPACGTMKKQNYKAEQTA